MVRVPDSPLAHREHAAPLGAREAARCSPSRSCGAATRDGESVAEFVGRRLGREALGALVAPFLDRRLCGRRGAARRRGGLPALRSSASAARLDRARRRSLRRSLRRARARAARLVVDAQQGSGRSRARWRSALGEPPALGTRGCGRSRATARLTSIRARAATRAARARVVVAAPRRGARPTLLRGARRASSRRRSSGSRTRRSRVAPVGIDARDRARAVEGFGFLVPREEKLDLLGASSRAALPGPCARRAASSLHCILGGARWPGAVDAARRRARSRALRRGPRARARDRATRRARSRVARWPRAVPQPGRDHRASSRTRARAGRLPGLALAGGYLDGVARRRRARLGVRAAAARTLAVCRAAAHERASAATRRVRVQGGDERSSSPPGARHCSRARIPISSSVSRQSATNAGQSTASRFTPARRELGETHVGVRPDPGRAAEPRLERTVQARAGSSAERARRAPRSSRSTARGSSARCAPGCASQQSARARQCAPRRVARRGSGARAGRGSEKST